MAFSCELLCRACMEPFSVNSAMPLVNKKKKKKTSICNSFEMLTSLKVEENDQLPQQLCLGCVSELNRSFAFREKCIRTSSTLRAYLDLSDDDEELLEAEEFIIRKSPAKKNAPQIKDSKEDAYEEIEVTQEMVEAAKSLDQAESDVNMVVEIEDEINNLLNPTSLKVQSQDGNNELFFIIEGVTDTADASCMQSSSDDKHNETVSSENKFKCTICKMEFVRKKNFDNHMSRFHEGDEGEIEPESKRLRLRLTKENYSEQLKQNLQENPEAKKCKTCGALYLNEKSLKLHERRNACKQESYQCDVCNKIFTDQKLFTDHTESHPQQRDQEIKQESQDPLKKFQCTHCSRSFKMMSTLKDHLRTHTGDKPFVCSICNRGFSQNTNLKQHLRRHTAIKPFKCDHENCSASFVSKGELDSHSRTHTGAHPFSCDQCSTGFTTSSSLLKHKRIHSGEKPYACDFCPMRFTALGTLRNHTRTHTGEKPNKCRFCKRAFTQKSDMSAHERTHTGQRPYVCKICNSAFHQSGTLKTHMKIHSKSEKADEGENDNE